MKDTKNITIASSSIKAISEKGEFEAVIATLGSVDSDGDIIAPGAFGNASVSIVPAHNHGSVPLGKAKMEDRSNEAIAVGQFNLDIQPGKEWHSALKFDLENGEAVQEWSFGFRVLDAEDEVRDGKTIRILKRMDVMEISPVLRGAGVNTRTLDVKKEFEEQLDETLTNLDSTIERAKKVAKARSEKRRKNTISNAYKEKLANMVEKCQELAGILAGCDVAVDGELSPEVKTMVEMAVRGSRRHVLDSD